VYTGYYPSWSDNWFDATGKNMNEVFRASNFARIPANYTHVMVAFAQPNFAWGGMGANNWSGTGVNFNGRPSDIKAAIDVLHARNMKVVLAVGGATYNNWGQLSAEGHSGGGATINAFAQILRDLNLDGLDVDYEVDGVKTDEYAGAVKALRKAVDLAGGNRILSVAGWSTGADCTAATANDPQCIGVGVSFWGGKAGGERQLVRAYPALATAFNLVNVMSYDARFENYDGVTAWKQYRALFPSSTIVSIGLETAPEGWQGGQLVVNNGDAQCTGSVILKNSYGATINQPYSVQRYVGAVVAGTEPNRNPRDGAMLWSILKTANGSCGSAPLASPGSIGSKNATLLSLPDDPALQQAPWR
jgi:Glycosyl hydrolases family 18